jgi:NitT/TauT family transport system substrate-binding protein
MHSTSRFFRLGVLSVALLVVAACAPTGGSAPAQPPAQGPPTGAAPAASGKPSGAPKKVRIASIPPGSLHAWPYQLATKMGWFAEEGLEPEVTYTYEQVQAMIGGSVDIMSSGADEILAANSRGADIVVVGMASNRPGQFLVTAPEITDIRQIQGKGVGMTDFGSSDYAIAARLLKARGVDLNSVTFRKIGGSRNRFAALEAGQIQATPLDIALTVRAQQAGKNVLGTPDDFGRYPWNVLALKRDWGQANRDAVLAFLRVTYRAMGFMNDPKNDGELMQHLPAAAEMDPALVADVMQLIRNSNIKMYDSDRPQPADLEPALELARENGVVRGEVDLNRMVDTSYYDTAIVRR